MGVSGIGGTQQPFVTPLSSGPAAAQRTQEKDPVQELAQAAEEEARQAERRTSAQPVPGGTTPTRGQNLNITV
ncbi:hypothetical protein [Azospirillum sp. SYSU D00513]|uniref:hypothetical protein n=1 Tax=Azospirillum sp. SYSU D00513 TaxID=2812561 RepID=UPI001A95C6B9|nr:hypothetical protein [Azospirillum sp. SYSU D00513]